MAGTRDRIMDASSELFRRNGYAATGVKQIVTAANAPFGSVYHFFPGGKEQLAEEAIRSSGPMYVQLFELILTPAPDLITGIRELFAGAAATLEDTDFEDACPIATIALEVASTNERLRKATADVFTDWISAGAEHFVPFGLPDAAARELTIAMVAALEGAFVLGRALRSTEPVYVAGRSVASTAQAALDEAGLDEAGLDEAAAAR